MKRPIKTGCLCTALLVALASAPAAAWADAADLDTTCRAESTYDLDIGAQWLVFQRQPGNPAEVRMGGGQLQVDRADTPLNLADRDRLVLFEQVLRDLVPDVKAVARRGVDLALEAVREEMRDVTGAAPNAEAQARLQARRDQMHARIDASTSTRDWQGEAFEREMQAVASELVPLLAADVARRAMELAMAGDLAGGAALQRRAQSLPQSLRARIESSLAPLRPDVARLCPRIEELAGLNAGMSVRLDDGSRLELLRLRQ